MNLNIDQLDSEERKKINALLRERQDANRDKGVEYIFRRPDEREDFLLGKKVDMNKMVKDDKSMMGESESEFQERMEKRKVMQLVLEDPMSIIQLKEQQARKVALEKKIVHQRLAKKYQSKFQRNRSVSSNDSHESDCKGKLRQLLSENYVEDDDDELEQILSTVKSNDKCQTPKLNKKQSKYDRKSPSSKINKRRRSSSRDYQRKYSSKPSKEENKYSTHRKHKRSRSRSNDYNRRNRERTRSIDKKSNQNSRHDRREDFNDKNKVRYNHKSKMTKEEIEKRLEEMRHNAKEWNNTIENLDKKFQKQDQEQAVRVEKDLKLGDEYIFNEMVKLNKKNEYSVQNSIDQRKQQNKIDKVFKR